MKSRGITLVSLVVTVIVLIILAGISITFVLGDNGIITIAKQAKQNMELAQMEEDTKLNELYTQMLSAEDNNPQVTMDLEVLKTLINTEIDKKMSQIEKDKNPSGTVISYMGTSAPEGYLFCDGAIYNIADYSSLAEQIKTQFGSYNYWGGDGTTTFAVPNLQGEFLRGYSKNTSASKSEGVSTASIGKHQNPTLIPDIWLYKGTTDQTYATFVGELGEGRQSSRTTNYDLLIRMPNRTQIEMNAPIYTSTTDMQNISYAIRPTNTAVLYCIKY